MQKIVKYAKQHQFHTKNNSQKYMKNKAISYHRLVGCFGGRTQGAGVTKIEAEREARSREREQRLREREQKERAEREMERAERAR
eukprot:1195862-Prorocentrum_minimum.AAC.7